MLYKHKENPANPDDSVKQTATTLLDRQTVSQIRGFNGISLFNDPTSVYSWLTKALLF